jgi:hypothetical protein
VRVHREVHNVPRIESQICVPNTLQTPHKQTRDDQQHQRTTDLRDNEKAARALVACGCGARVFVQQIVQISPRGAKRRSDSGCPRGVMPVSCEC